MHPKISFFPEILANLSLLYTLLLSTCCFARSLIASPLSQYPKAQTYLAPKTPYISPKRKSQIRSNAKCCKATKPKSCPPIQYLSFPHSFHRRLCHFSLIRFRYSTPLLSHFLLHVHHSRQASMEKTGSNFSALSLHL
ncbi:hypothetical protein QBC36DRAFT_26298 [Triangularia setosa]|uniref:Uncharacterized protein n=1 Tax=Triangularia setosa TaxID=2587417 RepID=A0AAN6W4K7_9PEZI|nr:hypothetical protein QBC36DRAFT_26298 [Podospora setosa]